MYHVKNGYTYTNEKLAELIYASHGCEQFMKLKCMFNSACIMQIYEAHV